MVIISSYVAFGELKISGGNYSGRLEFRRSSGSWVSVCRDGFDDDAANVACRQLGYVQSSDIYTFDEYVNTIALLFINPLGPNLGLSNYPIYAQI